jgi:hypothetical protein
VVGAARWRARPTEDLERVAAMRAHLGDGFPLMADADMASGATPRSPSRCGELATARSPIAG